jgi:hypothetical protein
MKTTNSARIGEELETIWNRSGQLVYELTELGTELASLETMAAKLAERARTFTPAPERHGIYTRDPAADTSDPRETLALVKERIRRTAEILERARGLLNDQCEAIARIVG